MSANKNRYSLEKGFLLLKSWSRLLRQLPPEEGWSVFWEIYDYQDSRGGKTVPYHGDNDLVQGIIEVILPTIDSRIDGSKGGAATSQSSNESPPTTPPYHTTLLQLS